MNDRFKGQVIVITGGGGILCGAFAREFGRLGAKVAILQRRGKGQTCTFQVLAG